MYYYYKVPVKVIMKTEVAADENGEPIAVDTEEIDRLEPDAETHGAWVGERVDENTFIIKTRQAQTELEPYVGAILPRWDEWFVK